jgi:RNA polymerase sigma-70 factor (ECF subfamily)
MRDAELAEGILNGSIDFKVLWDAYWDRVHGWLYPMFKDAEDARDLTNCVLTRAWQRLGRYDPKKSSLCTWLHWIATSVVYSTLRKRRVPTVSLDWMTGAREPTCEGPAEQHERTRLWQAVSELPELERAVLEQHYHEGYSWTDVAERLGVSVRTAKFHAARGLALLAGKL